MLISFLVLCSNRALSMNFSETPRPTTQSTAQKRLSVKKQRQVRCCISQTARPFQYPILLTHIKSFSTSVKLWHVEFPESPYTALEAPYTEVLLWSLKDGHKTAEAKEKALKDLGAIQEKFHGLDLKEAGISRGTLGPVVEESEAALALVLGWTSPEVWFFWYLFFWECVLMFGVFTLLGDDQGVQ